MISSPEPPSSPVIPPPAVATRPVRQRQIPAKFKDYIGGPTLINQVQLSTPFLPHYDVFVANIATVPEPYTYQQAVQYPE